MQCNAMQCDAMQCLALPGSALLCLALLGLAWLGLPWLGLVWLGLPLGNSLDAQGTQGFWGYYEANVMNDLGGLLWGALISRS